MGNGKISKSGLALINNLEFLADKAGNNDGKINKAFEQQELSKSLMNALSSGQLKQKDFDRYKAQSNCPLNTVFATNPIEKEQQGDVIVHETVEKTEKPVEAQAGVSGTQENAELSTEQVETADVIAKEIALEEISEEVKTEAVEGQEKTEEAAATKPAETETVNVQQAQPVSKKQAKVYQDLVKEYVRIFAKNKSMTLTMMMADIDSRTYLNDCTKEKDEIKAIADVINAQTLQSKDDINKLAKVVKNTLGKDMTSFQKEVLNDMVRLAERDAMVAKAGSPTDKYNELRKEAIENKQPVNYQALYTQALKESNVSGDYQKEAEAILKAYVKNEAYKTYISALLTIDEEAKKAGVAKNTEQIIAELNERFKDDAIMLEVIKENEKVCKNNTKEGLADVYARDTITEQRRKELSHITYEDLKELEKRNPKLATKLWAVIKDKGANGDGTYNMDALYKSILEVRAGADNFVNKSRYAQLSEYQHILEDQYKGLNLSKDELAQLLEFMKIDYAKNTHYLSDALGVVPPAGGGALGVIPAIHRDVINVSVDITTLIKLSGLSEEAIQAAVQDLSSQLGNKAVISTTGSGITQQIHINIADYSDNILQGVAGAALAVLAAILISWAIGEMPDEKACTNLTEDASNIKETCGNNLTKLKEYIAQRHPQNATRSLNMLLDLYALKQKVEFETKNPDKKYNPDTDFDTAGFIDFISKMGGSGSVANCQELIGALAKIKAPEVTPPPAVTTKPVEQPKYELDIEKKEVTLEVPPCSHKHYVKHGDTWSTLIHTYYQATYDKYGWKATLKALREALGAKASDKDLPYYVEYDENGKKKYVMELPCELLGIDNKAKDLDKNRDLYNTNKFEAGNRTVGKPLEPVEKKVDEYYAWDETFTDAQGNPFKLPGSTAAIAVENLESAVEGATGEKRTYDNRKEKIEQFDNK